MKNKILKIMAGVMMSTLALSAFSIPTISNNLTIEVEAATCKHNYVEDDSRTEESGGPCGNVRITKYSVCTECGREKKSTKTEKRPHDYKVVNTVEEGKCSNVKVYETKKCSVCGDEEKTLVKRYKREHAYKVVKTEQSGTCGTVKVYNLLSCTYCGDDDKKLKETKEVPHDFKPDSSLTKTTGGPCGDIVTTKYSKCSRCGKKQATGTSRKYVAHKYTKLYKTKQATCVKDGYKQYKCSVCNAINPETTPIKCPGRHTYNTSKAIKSVKATCTESGYSIYGCKGVKGTDGKTVKCSSTKQTVTSKALGHKWKKIKESSKSIKYQCTRCKEVKYESKATTKK